MMSSYSSNTTSMDFTDTKSVVVNNYINQPIILIINLDMIGLNICQNMINFINDNNTFIWSEQAGINKNIYTNFKPLPIISGTVNGLKTIKEFRKNIKGDAHLLKLPTVFVDTHQNSLILGQFDHTINLSFYKSTIIPPYLYDFDKIIVRINSFRAEWYNSKNCVKKMSKDIEARWSDI